MLTESGSRFVGGQFARFRNATSDELDLFKDVLQIALASGNAVTLLSGPDEEDPETSIAEWHDRNLGLLLDNIILALLPIGETGEILADADRPAEFMTAAGMPLKAAYEDGRLALTDPYGRTATVQEVLCKGPKVVVCRTDTWLMADEWFADEPLGSGGKSARLTGLEKLSLSTALLAWDKFEGRTATSKRRIKVRSRATALREFASGKQIYRVRCLIPADALDGDGMPRSAADLTAFEDDMLLHLVRHAPLTLPLAAVTSNGFHDLFYVSKHAGALKAALRECGDGRPFRIETIRCSGDQSALLDRLAESRTGSS